MQNINTSDLSNKTIDNVLSDTLSRYEHVRGSIEEVKSTLDDLGRGVAFTVENTAETRKVAEAIDAKIDAAFAQIGMNVQQPPKTAFGKALKATENAIDKATPYVKIAAVLAGLGYAGTKGFHAFQAWRAEREAEVG